jgi:hypothetical protein
MAGSAMAKTKSLHVPAAYGESPNGWTWSRLDDVSEGVFDCPHSTPKLTDTGPFVVRTQDIITGVFRADQAGRVSEETYAERIARVTPSRVPVAAPYAFGLIPGGVATAFTLGVNSVAKLTKKNAHFSYPKVLQTLCAADEATAEAAIRRIAK